jgi:uncharacterized protein (TIGR02452 family)
MRFAGGRWSHRIRQPHTAPPSATSHKRHRSHQHQFSKMLDLAARRRICEDTIARSRAIAESTPGGSLTNTWVMQQLGPLSTKDRNFPNLMLQPIEVHNSDAFELARTLTPTTGKIGVLNLANSEEPGGGWRYTLSKTQEEALCYSSTLYATLEPRYYPWSGTAGIISPGVVVFKDTLDNGCVHLPPKERHVVAVFTVAAPCLPGVTEDGEDFSQEAKLQGVLYDLKERILLILRMAAMTGVTNLVLGAMGCGAYGCPPRAVAREMKKALELLEFKGWFERVVFAVYAAGPSGQRNLEVFQDIFHAR